MLNLDQFSKQPLEARTYQLGKLFLILFIISLPFSFSSLGSWLASLIFLCIFLGVPFGILYILEYKNTEFSVGEDKITINSGIITKSSKTIPYANIQNVSAVSGLMQRMFNISSLNIWTASPGQFSVTSGRKNDSELHKPDGYILLDSANAQWLKDFIASKHK